MIIDALPAEKRRLLHSSLLQARSATKPLTATPNQFARRCLCREETGPEQLSWDFTPCFFLKEMECSIYQARPLGCRTLVSLQTCKPGGEAVVPPLLLTISTVLMQLVEHLNRFGGAWGVMDDVLRHLLQKEKSAGQNPLLPARPLPGFLIPPGEEAEVNRLLQTLYKTEIDGQSFAWQLENLFSHTGSIS